MRFLTEQRRELVNQHTGQVQILTSRLKQVMTYLIENETAALIIPSRFIAQLHPHFREVMQVL